MEPLSPSSEPLNQQDAQKEVDQLLTFQRKLEDLSRQEILILTTDQKNKVEAYVRETVAELNRRFEVDTTFSAKRLSWGMRITTFLGGAALCAGVYFFFLRIWGSLSTLLQIVVLITGTAAATLATHVAAKKERTLYFASLLGLVAFACFVVNLVVFGATFNITPSPNAFLVWGVFALLLAYGYGMRLALLAGLLSLLGFLSMEAGTFCGVYWADFGERPENFILAGTAILIVPSVWKHPTRPGFAVFYRLVGLLSILGAILTLAHWGGGSYFYFKARSIEDGYQIVGFLLSALTVWTGIRKEHSEVTNIGAVFFTIFLYTKFYDWWWDWMPKYQFFLLIGVISIVLLVFLKKLRQMPQGGRA